MAIRVSNRHLDSRLKELEDRLGETSGRLARLEEHRRFAEAGAQTAAEVDEPADATDKISRLEAIVCRLDERVQKITETLVSQASRWS